MRMVPFFSEVGERAHKEMITVIVKNGRSILLRCGTCCTPRNAARRPAPVSGARA